MKATSREISKEYLAIIAEDMRVVLLVATRTGAAKKNEVTT